MPCKEQTHIERLCQGGDPLEVSAEKRRDNYYLRVCKLTADDIPALIEIACRWPSLDWSQESDPFGVDVSWDARMLPVSAWRSLGELQAEAAIEPLIGIIVELGDEFDDWVSDELPAVFAQIGPASVEPLLTLASDQDACDLVRESAVRALGCVAVKHPETSPRVVPFLTAMINSADQNAIQLNTSLMSELVGLNAREAAEAIEKAFAANRIDVAVMGDWERVREALGVDGQGLAMPANPFDSLADLRQEWRAAAEPETNFLAIQCPDETETPREKVGRNDPCPCGSGKKYKKCCLRVASGP